MYFYETGHANFWDNSYPSGGNYWSDYTGVDLYWGPNQDQPGSDGIGDTPYIIDDDNQDNYPFMSEYGWRQKQVETATGTGAATFETDAGAMEDLTAIDEATLPEEGKPDLEFPHGFFSFNVTELIPGQTINVTITLPFVMPAGSQYWKYHDPEGWLEIPVGSNDGDEVITITLTDGGVEDDDRMVNGVIVEEGGHGKQPPDFSISTDPDTAAVQQGASTTATVTVTEIRGYSFQVSLSASGQPSGVTVSFDPETGTPTFTSTMEVKVGGASTGTYTITITALGTDGKPHLTLFTLTVTTRPPVGGIVIPVNKFELMTSWIRLCALIIITASITVIVAKRRPGP